MERLFASGTAAAALVAGTAAVAWADAGGGAGGMYYGHPGMMGGWFGGLLMMLIFVALIVAAVVVTFRLLGHEPGKRSSGRALDILNERFARGEIDRAEYEDRRKALESDSR